MFPRGKERIEGCNLPPTFRGQKKSTRWYTGVAIPRGAFEAQLQRKGGSVKVLLRGSGPQGSSTTQGGGWFFKKRGGNIPKHSRVMTAG